MNRPLSPIFFVIVQFVSFIIKWSNIARSHVSTLSNHDSTNKKRVCHLWALNAQDYIENILHILTFIIDLWILNCFSTGWPVQHGRVFLIPCKKWLVRCTRMRWRISNKSWFIQVTRKTGPCLTGHPVPRNGLTQFNIYNRSLNLWELSRLTGIYLLQVWDEQLSVRSCLREYSLKMQMCAR